MEPSFSVKLITFFTAFSSWQAYGAILGVLFICGLGVPIPEDITLLAAGILAAIDTISLTGALIAGFIGVMIGDSLLFFTGRYYGERAFKLPILRSIFTPERIYMARRRVRENSRFICFTARFLPGLRAPIFLTSGVMGVPPKIFFALDGFAALISVPVWVVLGWYFGKNMDKALDIAKEIQVYLIIGVVVLIIGYIFFKKHQRKRRELISPK